MDRLNITTEIDMNIDSGNRKPFGKNSIQCHHMIKCLKSELDKTVRFCVEKESKSPWCNPVKLVKNGLGKFGFVFDGGTLYQVTKYNSYLLPRIDRNPYTKRDANFIPFIDISRLFGSKLPDQNKIPVIIFRSHLLAFGAFHII